MAGDDIAPEPLTYTLKADSGIYHLTGLPIALILNSGNRIEVSDFSGTSKTQMNPNGTVDVSIEGRIRRGTSNEGSVLKILRSALEAESGSLVSLMAGEDARGEDGKMRIDQTIYAVQVVTVPSDRNLGKEIASGKFDIHLTEDLAVGWISGSIEHKLSITTEDRKRTILALDARHVGMLSERAIIDKMLREKPEIAKQGFAQIWLVGPITSRCVRIC